MRWPNSSSKGRNGIAGSSRPNLTHWTIRVPEGGGGVGGFGLSPLPQLDIDCSPSDPTASSLDAHVKRGRAPHHVVRDRAPADLDEVDQLVRIDEIARHPGYLVEQALERDLGLLAQAQANHVVRRLAARRDEHLGQVRLLDRRNLA